MAPHLHEHNSPSAVGKWYNIFNLNVFFKAMEKSKMNKPSIFGAEESTYSGDGGD